MIQTHPLLSTMFSSLQFAAGSPSARGLGGCGRIGWRKGLSTSTSSDLAKEHRCDLKPLSKDSFSVPGLREEHSPRYQMSVASYWTLYTGRRRKLILKCEFKKCVPWTGLGDGGERMAHLGVWSLHSRVSLALILGCLPLMSNSKFSPVIHNRGSEIEPCFWHFILAWRRNLIEADFQKN